MKADLRITRRAIKEAKLINTKDIMVLPEWMSRKSFLKLIDEGNWEAINKNLKELMDSMKSIGLVQPIGVCEAGSAYLLIFGLRRLIAAKLLKWKQIKCVVHEYPD